MKRSPILADHIRGSELIAIFGGARFVKTLAGDRALRIPPPACRVRWVLCPRTRNTSRVSRKVGRFDRALLDELAGGVRQILFGARSIKHPAGTGPFRGFDGSKFILIFIMMRLSSVWLAKQYDLWLQMGRASKEGHGLKPHLLPYFLAVVSVGVTTLGRWLLDPIYGADHPLLLYYGALAVTAWYGGWWPALFSLLLSYLAADWFFIPPRYALSVLTFEPVHLLGCWSFLTTGILIAVFGEATKRAQHRAEYNARTAEDRGRILEREITERKRAESQIEQANRELERRVHERTAELALANQELEAFSHSVSHDLRSPLRSIRSFTQMLKEQGEGKLDEEEKQMLQLVIQSARRMDELVQDLFSLSHAARGDLQRRPVNLSALVQRIATRVQATEPQHEVEFVIAPNLVAHGDERLLRIALENLLNNAWKFTGRRARGRIEFGAEQQAGRLVYFVRDNGAGFDMTHASQLFGAFQRLHSDAEFPGTGIGLATVQRIINRHGGQIWAEGAVNQGATFYFILPGGNC